MKPRGDKLTLFLFVFLLAIRQELAGMLAGPFVGRDDDIVRWTRCPTVWTESPVRSDWG